MNWSAGERGLLGGINIKNMYLLTRNSDNSVKMTQNIYKVNTVFIEDINSRGNNDQKRQSVATIFLRGKGFRIF